MRVLVTGTRAPAALHLCRILNDSGMEVYAADSVSYAITKKSNSIREFVLLPSPKYRTTHFISELKKVISVLNIDLLIPTCEESFYISMFKEELSRHCDVLVGDFNAMRLLHNKHTFVQFVDKLGFVIPRTQQITPEDNLEDLKSKYPGEIVLKKIYSRFSDDVVFVKSAKNIPERILKDSSWIIQEKVIGNQYCSYGIARDGELLCHSVYQTEFTAGLGATIAFEYNERVDIEHFVKAVVKEFNYSGQISFDFIVNANNEAIPIECNPRTTSGIHLFGKEVSDVLLGKNDGIVYPDKDKKEMITFAMMAYGLSNVRNFKKLQRWVKILFTYKDIIYKKYDVKPYFYQMISLWHFWKKSNKHNNSVLTETTYDISWDGE